MSSQSQLTKWRVKQDFTKTGQTSESYSGKILPENINHMFWFCDLDFLPLFFLSPTFLIPLLTVISPINFVLNKCLFLSSLLLSTSWDYFHSSFFFFFSVLFSLTNSFLNTTCMLHCPFTSLVWPLSPSICLIRVAQAFCYPHDRFIYHTLMILLSTLHISRAGSQGRGQEVAVQQFLFILNLSNPLEVESGKKKPVSSFFFSFFFLIFNGKSTLQPRLFGTGALLARNILLLKRKRNVQLQDVFYSKYMTLASNNMWHR